MAQTEAAYRIGARAMEIHTGKYCDAINAGDFETATNVLEKIKAAARLGHELGLEVHAGHGIAFNSVNEIALIPQIVELNIGHYLIGEAIFIGLEGAINKMRQMMDIARQIQA